MTKNLPIWRKWMYGSGDLGFSLTSTIVAAYFAIFLTDVVGVRAGVAGIAIAVGKIWDWVNDPLFGYISDHTRTRWGRRRPFLLFGAIPFALVFTLMWWKPPLQSDAALVVYYAFVYVLYEATATMIYMPYFALTPELTSDYDERTSLTSVRAFFSIFGSLLAFTIPLAIIGGFSPENAQNVLVMGITFAVISTIPLFVVFFGTRERPEFMHQQQPGLLESLKASLKNRPFIFSAIIFLFTWLSIDILQTILLYFIKHGVDQEANSDLIMGTIFVVGIFALPLWTWTSRKLNKRLAYIIGMVFFAGVLLVLINLTPLTPLSIILGLCVLAGIGVSAAHVIPWSMIPDAIEFGELDTGKRYEGMFYSLISLSQKVASSVAIPLALLMLDITGYIPNSSQQPTSAVNGIRFLVGPIPAVLLSIGILFAALYPLGRERYTQIALELEERRLTHPAEEAEP
ncbi:MAG: MFS transporter [Anaerolineales bacterium]|nr:MAG: MFS transporter [Anaerolineales bacterium]